jgi:hypothetical protein
VSACFRSKPRRDIVDPMVCFGTELGEDICTLAVVLEKGQEETFTSCQLVSEASQEET